MPVLIIFVQYAFLQAYRHCQSHRKNSPVTQTTPEPTLLSWGGWPHEKKSPHPWPCCQTRSYHAYQVIQIPLFSNPLMSPFHTQLRNECQICLRFHRILTVILEMSYSEHCTQIYKLNRISVTSISKVARKYIGCCQRVQWWVTAPYSGGKLSIGAWKRGQDSHIGMFSLW